MISELLSSIKGIEIYPVISLLLSFIFFSGVLFKVARMSKSYREKMKNLPLDDMDIRIDDGA